MEHLVWNGYELVPDRRGRDMLIRMIAGLAGGKSREEIVADELSRLTPLTLDAAGSGQSGEQERAAAQVKLVR
jgi:hypothetical protein